jgi:c-di-GMP-binding flagellar brake protein YcgR
MPKAYLLKERRVYPRISVKVPVVYWLLEDLDEIKSILERKEKEKKRSTLNISLGGMCLLADEPLKDGNILSLEIDVPDAPKKMKAIAEVVWSNETGGGIHFLTMNDEDMNALKDYLDKLSSSR